jgi:sialidase-1
MSPTILLLFVSLAAPADESPQEAVVFAAGKDGYRSFRIPAVIVGPKGTLLAFAEGRRNGTSDSGDIDVVLRRSKDGGKTWGPLQVVVDDGTDTVGNPCPVLDRKTGRVWLPLTRNAGKNSVKHTKQASGPGSREPLICHSDDEGVTWSKPVNLSASVKPKDWTWYATGPGVGIQLRGGRLVVPCNHRLTGRDEPYSHVIYSDDGGKTWQVGGSSEANTNECQVTELDDGTLMLNMRSHHGKNRRAVATSTDRGARWSAIRFDDALVEPACQGSLIRLSGAKDRLLFSNPASTKRERMTVRLSEDGGKTWKASRELYKGSAAYSCLVELPEGQAGCLYEKDGYKAIVFSRFSLRWLADSPSASR